jgi:hypothetical protein
MIRKRRFELFVILIFTLVFACATFDKDASPEKRYYASLKWYNDNLTTYLDAYDKALPYSQVVWKEKFDPMWKLANEALGAWSKTIDSTEAESAFIELKETLILYLIDAKIIEIGG